jgi:hypothetical protein
MSDEPADDVQLSETIDELRAAAKAAKDAKEKKYFYDLVLKALALKHKSVKKPTKRGSGFEI